MSKDIVDVAAQLASYYDRVGWQVADGITTDRRLWIDDRSCAAEYMQRACRKIRSHMPERGERLLDIGCGPLEDPAYVELSQGFSKRHCSDVSVVALEAAQRRIGAHGVFYHGDFSSLLLAPGSFDCILSLHSLYHIEAGRQEEAVRKMIRLAKMKAPVLIAYKHDDSLLDRLPEIRKFFERSEQGSSPSNQPSESPPYAHTNSRAWWDRFKDIADVKIYPLHTFDIDEQRLLFPDNESGRAGFSLLADLEDRYSDLFTQIGKYCLICLRRLA
jgi:hypothetical protein